MFHVEHTPLSLLNRGELELKRNKNILSKKKGRGVLAFKEGISDYKENCKDI